MADDVPTPEEWARKVLAANPQSYPTEHSMRVLAALTDRRLTKAPVTCTDEVVQP